MASISEKECLLLNGIWHKPESNNAHICLNRYGMLGASGMKIVNIHAPSDDSNKTTPTSSFLLQITTRKLKDAYYPSEKNIGIRGEERVNRVELYETKISPPLGSGKSKETVTPEILIKAVKKNPSGDFAPYYSMTDYYNKFTVRILGFSTKPLSDRIYLDKNTSYSHQVVKSQWICTKDGCNIVEKTTLKFQKPEITVSEKKIIIKEPEKVAVLA